MESVYIETSVVSYLVARPSREPVTAWRQQLTHEWWAERRGLFACVIAQEVHRRGAGRRCRHGGKTDGGVAGFAVVGRRGGERQARGGFAGARDFSRQRPRRCESSGSRDLRGGGLSADVELPASGQRAGVAPAGEIFDRTQFALAPGLHAGRTYGNMNHES